MIVRHDLASRPEGEILTIDGQRMRHLGEGRFAPAEEPLVKRFANDDFQAFHQVA